MADGITEKTPEQLRSELSEALACIRRLELSNTLLSEENRLLKIKKYGASAERLSDAQLALLELEPSVCAAEVQAEAAVAEDAKVLESQSPRKKPVRGPLPADLPRDASGAAPRTNATAGSAAVLKS